MYVNCKNVCQINSMYVDALASIAGVWKLCSVWQICLMVNTAKKI